MFYLTKHETQKKMLKMFLSQRQSKWTVATNYCCDSRFWSYFRDTILQFQKDICEEFKYSHCLLWLTGVCVCMCVPGRTVAGLTLMHTATLTPLWEPRVCRSCILMSQDSNVYTPLWIPSCFHSVLGWRMQRLTDGSILSCFTQGPKYNLCCSYEYHT